MSFFKHSPESSKDAFILLSILLFFFSAQASLTIYIDALYLKDAILSTPAFADMKLWEDPERLVGMLYTFASLITLFALVSAPRTLRRFGNYRWTLAVLILHVLALLGLGLFDSAWFIIPLFVLEAALVSVLYFNFDVFLERYSKDENTGMIRGIMITIGSIAWLLPPFFSGMIIERWGFPLVYLTGAAIILPAIFIMMRYFSDFKDLVYDDAPLLMTKEDTRKHPNISRILWVNFFLQFFYAWMIIYAPIYFHDHIGISYAEFGLILTVALSAFVLFPSPLGWLADKVLGEKELLLCGFFLMGLTSLAIPFLSAASLALWWWALLLFVGRTGASIVETMTETYFFKQIDGHNASLIGYFRRSRPMAFIVAPLIASLLLSFGVIELQSLFTILGFVMLAGMAFTLRIKDTR
jgi:MFS family permease